MQPIAIEELVICTSTWLIKRTLLEIGNLKALVPAKGYLICTNRAIITHNKKWIRCYLYLDLFRRELGKTRKKKLSGGLILMKIQISTHKALSLITHRGKTLYIRKVRWNCYISNNSTLTAKKFKRANWQSFLRIIMRTLLNHQLIAANICTMMIKSKVHTKIKEMRWNKTISVLYWWPSVS